MYLNDIFWIWLSTVQSLCFVCFWFCGVDKALCPDSNHLSLAGLRCGVVRLVTDLIMKYFQMLTGAQWSCTVQLDDSVWHILNVFMFSWSQYKSVPLVLPCCWHNPFKCLFCLWCRISSWVELITCRDFMSLPQKTSLCVSSWILILTRNLEQCV